MKIFCVGRNYVQHAKELGNSVPSSPVIFMKPETALLRPGQAFFIPPFSNDIHYEAEIVIRINRLGKSIPERFAHRYYNECTVGIDFTARDLQQSLKSQGLPWELAKSFDGSAALGEWVALPDNYKEGIPFQLFQNENLVQSGNTLEMLFSFDKIISFVSQYFTLKIGDIIFTGTPAGVGQIFTEDVLKGTLHNQEVLKLRCK
jgi:2-keto-4-pentenoate hydratase/2-oxohepta-3-ene-1,7-dioic acid hydratase in catechol pathway